MFVVWRQRIMSDGAVTFSAVLMESKRIEGNSVRRYIKTLGSINEKHLQVKFKQFKFWQVVEERLSSVKLSRAEKARLRASIKRRMSHPSKKELEREAMAIQSYLCSESRFNKIC